MINNIESKYKKVFILSLIGLLTVFMLCLSIGTVSIPFKDILKILFNNSSGVDSIYIRIILYVRLPRVLVAILVGMALSISGTAIQSLFRNPMASPGIVGISSGASLGAVLCISLGLSAKSLYYIPVFASGFALITAFIIFKVSTKNHSIGLLKLILVGIAMSAIIRAGTQLILSIMEENQISEYVFWSMGSLANRRWEHVYLILVPILITCFFLIYFSRDLNILLLGEEESKSLGMNVDFIKKLILILTSIATALSVSVSGSITFVGLIVPHIMRLIIGSDNRYLIPFSCIGGSIFLMICDLISRTIIIPSEVSVGIITSVVGAPYLLYLIRKKDKVGEL